LDKSNTIHFLSFSWIKHDSWSRPFQPPPNMHEPPIYIAKNIYLANSSCINYMIVFPPTKNMILWIIHTNISPTLHKPPKYLAKNTHLHHSCIKYDIFNHVRNVRIFIIYVKNTWWFYNFNSSYIFVSCIYYISNNCFFI